MGMPGLVADSIYYVNMAVYLFFIYCAIELVLFGVVAKKCFMGFCLDGVDY